MTTATGAAPWVAPDLDTSAVCVLLCDADGNLFPSEEHAFEASAGVTNAFLEEVGVTARLTAEELQETTLGRTFRTTAIDLCTAHDVVVDQGVLDRWVAEELRQVTAHLATVLQPDPDVLGPLRRLHEQLPLAAVSSSALLRLDACFRATGLADLIPPWARYSAQDSLPSPTSKPDPAVYLCAGRDLGVEGDRALAIEDSPTGAEAAVAAGFPTIGNLAFVPERQRAGRAGELREVGVSAVLTSWDQVGDLVLTPRHGCRTGASRASGARADAIGGGLP